MRPTVNFALHALAAVALTAFAATSAAAGPATLKLGGAAGGGTQASGSHRDEIHIESYSWGTSQTGYKLDRTFVKSWSTSGDADAPPPPRGGVTVAAGDVDGSTADGDPDRPMIAGTVPNASAGQATGKRQHKPLTITKEVDKATPSLAKPLGKGSVWVRVSSPWAACRVGARYPSLELNEGTRRYLLQDVTVASCGGSRSADDRPTEEVAFYYNKIAFNYAATRDK